MARKPGLSGPDSPAGHVLVVSRLKRLVWEPEPPQELQSIVSIPCYHERK